MGYRSDVTIIFYARGTSKDAGRDTLLKLWFEENYPVAEAKGEWCAAIRHKFDAIIIEYEQVKWYEGYDHVQAVIAALRKFDDTFDGFSPEALFSWELIRIGEDDTDIEVDRGEYSDHLLYVSRSIRVDMAGID
jgi:hypothetical protein